MNKPVSRKLFSITAVIPCFNHGEYLAEAVSSVLAQQNVAVEAILIVDDGSTDDETVRQILEQAQNPLVTSLRIDHQGPGAARNAGLSRVGTEYALVLDADDRLHRNFAFKCISLLDEQPKFAVASSWIRAFGAADWLFRPRGGGGNDFVQRNECGSMAVLRLQAWQRVSGYSATVVFEDWDFYLRIVEAGWRVGIVEEPLAEYRMFQDSRNTRTVTNRPAAVAELVREHKALFQEYVEFAIQGREEEIARLRSSASAGPKQPPRFGDGSASHFLRNPFPDSFS